jgi:hypothetical protein
VHDADTIAVTATSRGLTPGQCDQARDFLTALFRKGKIRKFRHGDCVGGDAQLARIAKNIGFYVIAHPGHPNKKPTETKYRAFTDFNDEIMPVKEFIKRDHDMVDGSFFLLAAPYQDYEVKRSGTWTTVRYADKTGVTVGFVFPGRNRVSSIHDGKQPVRDGVTP